MAGLYQGCPTRNGDVGEKAIGAGPCRVCKTRVRYKMNKAGWPYYFCTSKTCGDNPQIRGKAAAMDMLLRITHWHAPARAFINNVHANLDGRRLIERKAVKPAPAPAHVETPAPAHVETPAPAPKPKRKRIGMIRVR